MILKFEIYMHLRDTRKKDWRTRITYDLRQYNNNNINIGD